MDKLAKAGIWLLARLEEPSTWAGGGVLAVMAHSYFGATGDALIAALAALGGFLAMAMPEKSP
jgi:hypothetical protein